MACYKSHSLEVYRPQSLVRGVVYAPEPLGKWQRGRRWLAQMRWMIAFWVWMLTGWPASILGSAYLAVKIVDAVRG